jgi:hypothetical protein
MLNNGFQANSFAAYQQALQNPDTLRKNAPVIA